MRNKLPAATLFALACSIGAAQTAEPVCTVSFLKGSVTESGNRPVTVFYVTDGARLGPAVDGVCRLLSGTKGSKTECATVAVDVPERTAFLTPTASSLGRSGLETGGRAAELVECLEKTVKPEVKRRLEGRAVTHVLMGHSFGGLFALSTIASRPELFDAWVAADPSLWWDGGVLIRMLEDKPAAGHSGAFVYAGFGSALRKTGGTTASRNLASEDRFRAALEGFAGPDAKVVVEDYPRETHGTIAVPVFHEAMKRLLIRGVAGVAKQPVEGSDGR